MAQIGRKRKTSTTKRRKTTGATKRKRKSRVSGEMGETLTINGVGRFTKKTCSTSKTVAESAADKIRNPTKGRGRLARVIKDGNSWCVFEGRQKKANAIGRKRA